MKKNKIGDLIAHPKLGEGTYRVTATAMTGGGPGHGPHDIYPDGHQLTLMRDRDGVIDWNEEPRRFYQSGCFVDSVMLPYCEPNVKEHAPLSAGASVDHGVDVETTLEHENRAADRGCCVSSCSISSLLDEEAES